VRVRHWPWGDVPRVDFNAFVHYYNHIRPHRALARRTPLQAYSARVKARPAGASPRTHFRVREDRVDQTGKISLRYQSRLYKIGIGRAHKGRAVKLLIADQRIRVIDRGLGGTVTDPRRRLDLSDLADSVGGPAPAPRPSA
jgi:hypothetical protein